MDRDSIYKKGYSFARDSDNKKKKLLLAASIGMSALIIAIGIWGFISNSRLFDRSSERISSAFDIEAENSRITQAQAKENAYSAAGLPYTDEKGRFTIVFGTPYASDQVIVVMKTNKDYDNVRKEAENVIAKMKEKVSINDITFLDSF